MAAQRKTKPLVYNLFDRGRQFTGQDRSNVDFLSMINLINSAATQEMAATGQLIGFYGHQVRQRFGMIPPETAHIDGKAVLLEPAFKTTEIKADKNGDVTHRAEFFENDSGEFARKQYLAKVGGFSTAVNYRPVADKLVPSGFYGFDYVIQPNYATNVGDGQLLDGLFIPENPSDTVAAFDSATDIARLEPSKAMIAYLLEQQVLQNYDNIHGQVALLNMVDGLVGEVNNLHQHISRQERKKILQAQRQQDVYTGMRGTVRSFDAVVSEAEQYLEESGAAQTTAKVTGEKSNRAALRPLSWGLF